MSLDITTYKRNLLNMSIIVSRRVVELPEAERRILEHIVGRPLLPPEKVHVIIEQFSPDRCIRRTPSPTKPER